MYYYYDTYMDRKAEIAKEIDHIKKELLKLGRMRPGSLSIQTRSWGGKYMQLSYTHRGRGHTQYVQKEEYKKLEEQLSNYRKFRDLTQEWVDLSLELCRLETRNKPSI